MKNLTRGPTEIVLSPETINAIDSAWKTANALRKSLADYFERQGKPMDERARHLDESLSDRAMFLNLMRWRFDSKRALKGVREKLTEEYYKKYHKNREEILKAHYRAQRQMEILSPYDLFTVYGR